MGFFDFRAGEVPLRAFDAEIQCKPLYLSCNYLELCFKVNSYIPAGARSTSSFHCLAS